MNGNPHQHPARFSDWQRPICQPKSLPGQKLLFPDPLRPLPSQPICIAGRTFLFDAGHGLPGVDETRQKILWDVD